MVPSRHRHPIRRGARSGVFSGADAWFAAPARRYVSLGHVRSTKPQRKTLVASRLTHCRSRAALEDRAKTFNLRTSRRASSRANPRTISPDVALAVSWEDLIVEAL